MADPEPTPTTVRVHEDGPVTTVVLDRPAARNAVDRPTAVALADAFRRFEESAACVAVLTGADGTFCSGADLKAFGTAEENRLEPDGDGPMGPTRMHLSKPVIAAIEGYAVAGGLELALWCDLRVAARDAELGVLSRRWGVPLIDGGTVRLPRLVGESRAMDLVLTGRRVGSEEAERIGLVNRVVTPGSARAAAEELARELAGHPQECLRADRRSVLAQAGQPESRAMADEFAWGLNVLGAAEDGVRQFVAGEGRHGAPSRPGADTDGRGSQTDGPGAG